MKEYVRITELEPGDKFLVSTHQIGANWSWVKYYYKYMMTEEGDTIGLNLSRGGREYFPNDLNVVRLVG